MKYEDVKNLVLDMKLGEKKTIYSPNSETQIFINKPFSVPAKLKNSQRYDPKKNFQIGLRKKEQKEFLPNHLRIMIDLELKKRENKEDSLILFNAIEKIYEGEDPEDYKKELEDLNLRKGFEDSYTDLILAQLFFAEQDINYDFGKVQPPRAYLMGYIRMIRLGDEEIDKLLWGSVRHPPRVKYRTKECLKQEKIQ